jgi:hypothetical protein
VRCGNDGKEMRDKGRKIIILVRKGRKGRGMTIGQTGRTGRNMGKRREDKSKT